MDKLAALDESQARTALGDIDGFANHLAEEYAREGHVYAYEGRVLVSYQEVHPLTRTTDIFVPFLHGEILEDLDSVRCLVLGMLAEWPQVDQVFVRTPPGLDLRSSSVGELYVRYLSKRASYREVPTNLDIQSVDPESVGFVHRLLAQAITRGHEGLGFQVRAEDLERHVREFYDFMSPGAEVKALVGLLGSEMVGHITWFPEAEDIVTGERYFEIVDVFVIEKYRDRGYSGALTAAVERYASEVEGTLLGNVSRESDASDDRLYQALHRGGWIPKFDIWVSRRRG